MVGAWCLWFGLGLSLGVALTLWWDRWFSRKQ